MRRIAWNRVFLIASLLFFAVFALLAGTSWLPALSTSAAWQRQLEQREPKLDARVLRQIESLAEAKRQRSPVERKIDSQLLFAARMHKGLPITSEVRTLETHVEIGEGERTVVDITAHINGELIEKLHELGVQVRNLSRTSGTIRASVRIDQITEVASLSQVIYIVPRQLGFTSRMSARAEAERAGIALREPRAAAPTRTERAERVRKFLSSVIPRLSKNASTVQDVPVAIEGDVAHRITEARNQFGFNGTGIKIGVISDGVSNLRVSQALGALGRVRAVAGQSGEGDEGTAMLEIIHAFAPGAELFFAKGLDGIGNFAENIRELRRLGCHIIVDDLFYFAESAFQDGQEPYIQSPFGMGLVAQAVADVTRDGALYFSSAGNEGSLTKGTSGVWEGPFLDGGPAVAPLPSDAGRIHSFGNARLSNQLTSSAPFGVVLQWSDPIGMSTNDYDLYVLNSTATSLLAASVGFQTGSQDPYEFVGAQPAGRRLVIAKFSGDARFIHLNTLRGRVAIQTSGQMKGHNTVADAFAVAATPAGPPFGNPPNPTGPYPGSFNAGNKVEQFTSDGPRRLFFRSDGTPFTPGDFLNGIVRQKPDITAADGVTVTGVGFFPTPFYGTSAAAPTAAAIAALIKSANPSLTNAQIREALVRSAIDIEGPGYDLISGFGIVMPINAAQFLGFSPMADLAISRVTLTELSGNGNGQIEPGERGRLQLEIKNNGAVAASGVSGALKSATPGVFITMPTPVSFGDLAPGATATTNVPVDFTLSSVAACDLRTFFELDLSYTGGPSPKTLEFEVQTGSAPTTIASVLDAAPPANGPRYSAGTGQQAGRLARTVVPAVCGVNTTPLLFSTAARRYDAYTFESCPTRAQTCATIQLSSPCANSQGLFAVAYAESFDPLNPTLNYLGDAGDAGIFPGEVLTFSVNVPVGKRLVVVVHELDPNGSTGCAYELTVSGLCDSCESSNLVCLEDDESGSLLQINAVTGDYLFTNCTNGTSLSGRGTIRKGNGLVFLTDAQRVNASFDFIPTGNVSRGSAVIRPGPGSVLRINDRNIFDNSCICR